MSAYGYSAYDTGFLYNGKIYPNTFQNYYGLSLFTPLNVNPFTAVPRDYATITLQWTQPQGSIIEFRLLSNRYGFPVDQNDGNILIDSDVFPGTSYADQDVIPGAYHYYGIYLLTEGVWNRAGFASCLMPFYWAEGSRMYNLLPTYFRELSDTELTQDATDNQYIQQFLNVTGWGMDYLRTQYNLLANHLNDPMAIPLGDLMNLAAELGMPFQPEVPASLMRKAAANWTHVCQERGTPGGIAEHVTLLTGYPVDLRAGKNFMLENDQSGPVDPAPGQWNAGIGYVPGELVTYGNYIYTCLVGATPDNGRLPGVIGTPDPGLGVPPTGTTSANTYWAVVQNTTDANATLANPGTVGRMSTWEAIYPSLDAGGAFSSPAGTLVNTIGLIDPVNTSAWTHGAFSVFNKEGTTQDIMLRSVSRIASDMTGSNSTMAPDQLQAVKDGLPIPWITTQLNGWSASVRYATDSIVLYDGMMFQAMRASTGATPPSPGTPLNANQTFEAGVTSWTAHNGITITQSSTQAYQGTYSMKITPDGTTANPYASSESISIIPGATYTGQAWVFIPAGWSNTTVNINWFDAFGQYISTTSGPSVNVAANTWTSISQTVTAPASAATIALIVQLTGTPAGSVVSYWDLAYLSCGQTPEWAVLSTDNRLRLMLSGYVAQSLTTVGNQTVQVIPFAEWYDGAGNLIVSNGQARVTPRVATPGTPGGPPNLSYDSFTLGTGTYLNGRQTDSQDQTWVAQVGSWSVSGFNGGTAWPSVLGSRSIATLTGLSGTTGANLILGVTFVTAPQSGQDLGIIFRMTTTSAYWRAGMTGLYSVTGGTSTLVATYSTPCVVGDRLSIWLNGNAITVYRNNSQVATTTNSYNATATLHGIVCEAVGV
jgi:hypothetical protein